MLTYISKRIFSLFPTILILITLSFFLMRLAPGSPFTSEKVLLPQIQANLEKEYHLDQPLWKQYVIYLDDVVHGDLGPSFKYPNYTVNQLIASSFPVSLKLGAWAIILASLIGITLGCIAAFYQNSWLDSLSTGTAMFGISVPNFVIAPVSVLVFAVILHWLPAGEWNNGAFKNMILPVIALALPQMAIITRIMRGSMIEVFSKNYIRTAKAKGLSTPTIIVRHALRPALMPVISYLGPALANIITGSVVIEMIFGLPGIGTLLVHGALNRDYTTVLGIVILICTLMIVFNLVVDLLYKFLNPKLEY